MKEGFRKWSLRIIVTCLFILGLLIGIVLNPELLYANKRTDGNYIIYHQQQLDPYFTSKIRAAKELLQSSTLYNNSLKFSVCLNDG